MRTDSESLGIISFRVWPHSEYKITENLFGQMLRNPVSLGFQA